MPLNFDRPRADPTLGRNRATHELVSESRARHPRTDILVGLRRVGGPWKQRAPEEQSRIDRYKRDLDQSQRLAPPEPDGWKYFSRDELVNITDAVLTSSSETFYRDHQPSEVRVLNDPVQQAITVTLVDTKVDPPLYCSQRITKEEVKRYNADAISVVDVCVSSAYRQMLEAHEGRAVINRIPDKWTPVSH